MTPTAKVEVIGSRQTAEVAAIVDTGFNGDLCVPIRDAVPLGLELVGELPVEFADGTRKNELLFAGSARFLGQDHEVEIMLTTSQDALIGTGLLNRYALAIQFPGGENQGPFARDIRRKTQATAASTAIARPNRRQLRSLGRARAEMARPKDNQSVRFGQAIVP